MNALHAAKAQAFDASGRLLVYAPPLLAGFRGAPLALSRGKAALRPKSGQRRNWARRRAYHG
jgi:hypothetical protein